MTRKELACLIVAASVAYLGQEFFKFQNGHTWFFICGSVGGLYSSKD